MWFCFKYPFACDHNFGWMQSRMFRIWHNFKCLSSSDVKFDDSISTPSVHSARPNSVSTPFAMYDSCPFSLTPGVPTELPFRSLKASDKRSICRGSASYSSPLGVSFRHRFRILIPLAPEHPSPMRHLILSPKCYARDFS